MKTYLVYVQLGQNPAPILYDSARQALDCKNLETFLITDKPFLHNLFPGKVIEYHRSHNRRALKSFNRRYPDKRSMAGGYWLNTLERIFALNVLKNHVEYDAQIIHTESDVYSYLNEEILVTLNEMNINVAMPRFSPERGIGSFVYFRNFGFLEGSLDSFQKILDRESIENDMELFGFALNSGLIQELPSNPEHCPKISERIHLIFDGAALGQYLFGQDPFHQNGDYVSGFINPFSTIQYEKAKWGVHEINGKKFVSFTYGGSKFVIVNLHLHSKEIIPEIDAENLIWTRVFNEANGISPRSVRTSGVTSVHAERPLIRTRIQTIRRLGLGNTLVLTARKLLRIIRSS
jgi:hypothetical protein